MPSKDLTFRLFGEDVNATASMRKLSRAADENAKSISKSFGETPKIVTALAVGAGAASVALAASFQTATTRLVTDAGESAKSLGMVREGILDISSKTGISAKDIASAGYVIESAGFHGANGLKLMSAAAEGAKIGGADMRTVADALSTVMTDYNLPASKAADTTSKLIATVSHGKTTMEELAGSLHSVLPGAEAAHLGLSQVLGAMATMTAEGISADQASENLNHAILSLQNPTQVQTKAMAAVGLSAYDVAKNLGKKGLTGTYEELTKAVAAHTKGGAVIISTFNRSKQAAQSADTMLKAMPASVKSLAQSYLDGSISQGDWIKQVKEQTPHNAALLKQFGTTASAAHGFSDALKAGQGPFSTYAAQMSKMTGGQVGLQVALHLTGSHMGSFEANTKAVAAASSEAGGHVHDWATIQQTFNARLAEAGASIEATGIRLGTVLLPPLTKIIIGFGQWTGALAANKPLLYAVLTVVGLITASFVGLFVAQKVFAAISLGARMMMAVFGLVRTVQLGLTAATYGYAGATYAATAGQKVAYAAGLLLNGTLVKSAAAWLAAKAQAVASGAATAVSATVNGAKTAAAWTLASARSAAVWAAMKVKAAASFVATAAAATVNGAKTAAVWIASVAKAAPAWIAMKAQAIAAFAATAASAIANGARMAAMWVAQKAAVLGYVAVQGILRAATLVATGAQWLFNAAMDANPVGLVILAVAALIAGIVLLVTHWKQVCAFIQSVWGAVCKWWADTLALFGRAWKLEWSIIQKVVSTVLGAIGGFFKSWWTDHILPVINFFVNAWKLAVAGFQLEGALISRYLTVLAALFMSWWKAHVLPVIEFFINGWKGAISFVGSIPGKIRGFFASAATWLLQAGKHVIDGLVNGLKGAIGAVTSTVSSIAGNVVGTFKNILGIHSPSRVFEQLGIFIHQGLVKGLASGASTVKSTVTSLADKVTSAFSNLAAQRTTIQRRLKVLDAEYETATKKHRVVISAEIANEQAALNALSTKNASNTKSALLRLIEKDNTALTKAATKREAITAKLTDAKKALADAQSTWNDQKSSTANDVLGLGNVVDVYTTIAQQHNDAVSKIADLQSQLTQLDPTSSTYTADQASLTGQVQAQQTVAASTANSTSSMISNLQTQVANTKRFQADLKTLLGMGLDPTTYQQLVSAGIGGGGLAAADDLISSGAGSVAQLKDLQSQLAAAGSSLGTDVANQLDGAGVQAAQGLVNGLNSQLSSVQASMDKIADTLVASIEKKLDIHSPSRVFEQRGKFIAAGLVKGIDSGRAAAAASVAGLVSVKTGYATAPGSTGLPGQVPAMAGRTAPVVAIENFHATPEQSPQDIAADLAWLARGGL